MMECMRTHFNCMMDELMSVFLTWCKQHVPTLIPRQDKKTPNTSPWHLEFATQLPGQWTDLLRNKDCIVVSVVQRQTLEDVTCQFLCHESVLLPGWVTRQCWLSDMVVANSQNLLHLSQCLPHKAWLCQAHDISLPRECVFSGCTF